MTRTLVAYASKHGSTEAGEVAAQLSDSRQTELV
jgi:menaquinone-dependent protoporphyrinogen IX oxidase